MKKIMQFIIMLVLVMVVFAVANEVSASTAKEKVYREYSLPKEVKKFPIKLTNGLTVTTTKINGKSVPVIKKGSKTVWQGKALATNSKIRFTVSKNNDTFFYYNQTVSGKGNIGLVGVSKAGKVFLNDTIKEDVRLKIDFLSANKIEVGVESGYTRFTSYFYLLYKDGSVDKLQYFDKEFAALAKKGQLKWNAGALGTTYKNLQPKVAYLDGKINYADYELYETWKVKYGFYDGKTFGKMESNQKVYFMLYRNVFVDEAIAKAQLKQLFGTPMLNRYGNAYMYKAGKYYVVASFEDDTTNIDFSRKKLFTIL